MQVNGMFLIEWANTKYGYAQTPKFHRIVYVKTSHSNLSVSIPLFLQGFTGKLIICILLEPRILTGLTPGFDMCTARDIRPWYTIQKWTIVSDDK